MKIWTVKQMLAEKPCEQYTEESLAKLWAGREKVTLLDIIAMDIPDTDKLWGSWRGLTKGQTDLVLDKVVTRAITNHALHCGVPSVEIWADNWLSGKDKSAWAAWEAAGAAEAAAGAAWEAAWAAARAAGAAAGAAAEAAAEAAELKLQIADVLAVLTALRTEADHE